MRGRWKSVRNTSKTSPTSGPSKDKQRPNNVTKHLSITPKFKINEIKFHLLGGFLAPSLSIITRPSFALFVRSKIEVM